MKKLLFILILLIPFVIKAESNFTMQKKWDNDLNSSSWNKYLLDGHSIYINGNEIQSFDILTGEKKTVTANFNQGFKYAVFDNRILTISSTPDKSNIEVTLYNEKLTQLNKVDIEYFDIDHCRMYNNKYIIISGEKIENGEFVRYVYFIDSNGDIYSSDKKRTISNTEKYKLDDNNYYYEDAYGNTYSINNYKMVSNHQNSDGTYLINKDDKILKINANNEIVKEVTIPVGHRPTIAKKGNTYYVIAYTNSEYQNGSYNIQIVLYTMDANLNLSEPTEPFPEERFQTGTGYETYLPFNHYRLFNINDHIYMKLGTTNTDYNAYEIASDLTITPVNNVDLSKKSPTQEYSYIVKIYDSNYLFNENHYSSPDLKVYLDTIFTDNYSKYYKIVFDEEDNAYINILYINNKTSKLELAKINSNGEILFRKTIYDWTPIDGDEDCDGVVDNDLNFFDDYLVIAANTTRNNIIKFYDYDGNEILDLSKDVNARSNLSFGGMIVFDRSIYFDYHEQKTNCRKGVSAYTNNVIDTLVLDATLSNPKTYIVYYELPFLVNTKVNGAGTVTAKQIRALTGSSVEFTVTPDPGFVLGVVKVTDANGNVLTFTNNTFVMPSADVTIEATFVAKNPNTQSFITYTLLGICAATGLLTVFLSSKKKQYE